MDQRTIPGWQVVACSAFLGERVAFLYIRFAVDIIASKVHVY